LFTDVVGADGGLGNWELRISSTALSKRGAGDEKKDCNEATAH